MPAFSGELYFDRRLPVSQQFFVLHLSFYFVACGTREISVSVFQLDMGNIRR